MSEEEIIIRLVYFGMSVLGMHEKDILQKEIGYILDLRECHLQSNGLAEPLEVIDANEFLGKFEEL